MGRPINGTFHLSNTHNSLSHHMATVHPKLLAPPPVAAPKSYINDPDIISLRESLSDGHSLGDHDTETLRKLYVHLREYEAEKRIDEDYVSAKKAHDDAEDVLSVIQSREPIERALSGPVATIDTKESYRTKWKESIAEFDKATEEKRSNIIARQRQSIERFNERWGNDMPRKYRKPSFRLMQLKQTEHTLANSGDYTLASRYHEEAEKLAREEAEKAQRRLVQDYKAAHHQMLQKQAIELQNFDSSRAEARRVMQSKFMIEMRAALNRDNVMKQRRVQGGEFDPKRKSHTWKKVTIPVPINAEVERRKAFPKALLPPLRPPNDPSLEEEEERNKQERIRMNKEFERRKEQEKAEREEKLRQFEEERKRRKRAQRQTDENFRVEPFMTGSPALIYKLPEEVKEDEMKMSESSSSTIETEKVESSGPEESNVKCLREEKNEKAEEEVKGSGPEESNVKCERVEKNEKAEEEVRKEESSTIVEKKVEQEAPQKKQEHVVAPPRQKVKTLYIGKDDVAQEMEDDSESDESQESEPEQEIVAKEEDTDDDENDDNGQEHPEVKTIYLGTS